MYAVPLGWWWGTPHHPSVTAYTGYPHHRAPRRNGPLGSRGARRVGPAGLPAGFQPAVAVSSVVPAGTQNRPKAVLANDWIGSRAQPARAG